MKKQETKYKEFLKKKTRACMKDSKSYIFSATQTTNLLVSSKADDWKKKRLSGGRRG